MKNIQAEFIVDGVTWMPAQIEQLAYQRNLHILHQMRAHGIEIKADGKVLTDDDIDFLTKDQAWEVSIKNRLACSGQEIRDYYQESFALSDQMWRDLAFSQDKPMKVSHCDMVVSGVSLEQFMGVMQMMQQDEEVGLAVHPEHFQGIWEGEDIVGIEPFGMYGTPTLVHVAMVQENELSSAILADKAADYPMSMVGLAKLIDDVTDVNIPYHQFKPTENGFAAKLAVYWPENTPEEIVEGHSLHLATEFYYGLKMIVEKEGKEM